jgi:hypothetical protein
VRTRRRQNHGTRLAELGMKSTLAGDRLADGAEVPREQLELGRMQWDTGTAACEGA